MFEKMKNLDSAFRATRRLALLSIGATAVLCVVVVIKCFNAVEAMQDKIYVLANGKALEAFAADRKDNIPVEAKDHVRMFHFYFFALSPDEKSIQENMSKALYLADESAKREYDNLKEKNFFNNMVSGNVSQTIGQDSVEVNLDSYPYYFRYHAIQVITRPTSEVTRRLVTEGYLRNVSRSDHNSHGFLIEKWRILDNSDLTIKRR